MSSSVRFSRQVIGFILLFFLALDAPVGAQQVLGSITGTVTDSSGAAIGGATVKALNIATNLEVDAKCEGNGTYVIQNLPAGTYKVTVTKEGFETETHTEILVNANRTSTVDSSLKVGQITSTVEVTATPLMNQVNTTNGYVVDQLIIENTPLGTGSFTQLAILAPGVHADFLGGAGANTGLGNQAIYSNGQRDTSNSFSLNGISTNNLFNGNSTSQVGENRFVLNTGENFGAGGQIQTSTSVYNAIGQALPTPPAEAIQEIAVNAAMYDATQGANSGAHISVLTKSGTNALHGELYEKWQNSDMNAAPFFYNASPAITSKVPFLNRNQFGATLGGPIKKDRLFYFVSYQGIRIADASESLQDTTVPLGLTNDRTAQGIVNLLAGEGKTITAGQISPVSLALLNAKLPNGQYIIPNPTITNEPLAAQLGYDVAVQGPNAQSVVDQGIVDLDYVVNDKDRLSGKYFVQANPTTNPFGSVGSLLGFAQQLSSESQVGTINNTVILTPTLTWEQRVGFTRLKAFAESSQAVTPADIGINLLGSTTFPQISISNADPTLAQELQFGPGPSFGNAGMFQNNWEYGSTLNWVKGRHTFAFGALWDHTQLNVINHNTSTDSIAFTSLLNFIEGNVRTGGDTTAFSGSANRYYRSDTIGAFVNDTWKVRNNLSVTLGIRWDYDGPLTEKYGRLTDFNGNMYSYNAATDSIVNSGLEIAGNNPQFATPGASDSLLKNLQAGFAPRVGIAYSPTSKLTIRTGYGIYYDRGELFTYLSPTAGGGFNGPFGVTLAPPFVTPIVAQKGATFSAPFGTTPFAPPPGSVAAFQALLPNIAQTESGNFPANNLFGPFLFGGYDINNKLPYTQNWTFDIQYQASNNWLFSAAYVGNHGTHLVLPIPFNEPQIATPSHPVNGQIYSYGGTNTGNCCALEPISTSEFSGNAPIRVPYIGYDMNSVLFQAQGISNYNALQLQVRKRLSFGLQLTGTYTWSHSLDEQSANGLFFTGNNPLTPQSSYASSDFDQTHVFLVNYTYAFPKATSNKMLGNVINGWVLSGQTVAQSGQPYSIYDYSGSVGSLYFGTDIELANPIVPLIPGVTTKQAELQGTTGVNAGKPLLNAADFYPQFVAPGTNGVPPADASGADVYESLFGASGRNIFRAPFQVRFDMSLGKDFAITERYHLRLNFDAFNMFNHPDFDAPDNNVRFFPSFSPPPRTTPPPGLGVIQHTLGSSRFLQLRMNFSF